MLKLYFQIRKLDTFVNLYYQIFRLHILLISDYLQTYQITFANRYKRNLSIYKSTRQPWTMLTWHRMNNRVCSNLTKITILQISEIKIKLAPLPSFTQIYFEAPVFTRKRTSFEFRTNLRALDSIENSLKIRRK